MVSFFEFEGNYAGCLSQLNEALAQARQREALLVEVFPSLSFASPSA